MKSVLKKIKLNRYQMFLVLIIVSVFLYGRNKICGFTLFPDEFGYWASAAKKIGYDWSQVAGMGSYYSFGYSMILTPILKLFRNGVAAYRFAITVNCLMMCVAAFLLCRILKYIYPELNDWKRTFCAGIGVLYPSWIFYMQMTLTESLLMFLYVVSVCLLLELFQNKSIWSAVLLAIVMAYMYTVHMRTVGILISCVIVLLLWAILEPQARKTTVVFFAVLAVMAGIAWMLKQETVATVFARADAEVLQVNDYGSQWKKFEAILNVQGFWKLIKELLAKVYYLGMAGFGIFYWVMGWCIVNLIKFLKNREGSLQQLLAIFLFLSTMAELLISTIFMYQGGNVDTLVYGRYTEFVMPVLLGIGVCIMLKAPFLRGGTLVLGTVSGLLTMMILDVIETENRSGMRGYMAVGISYLYDSGQSIYRYFQKTWLMSFLLMVIASLLIYAVKKWKYTEVLLSGILMIEICLGLWASHNHIYQYNAANFIDSIISDTLIDQVMPGERVIYLDEGIPEFVDFLQMQLMDIPIEVADPKELCKEYGCGEDTAVSEAVNNRKPEFLITGAQTAYKEEIQAHYDKCLKANTFFLFYDIS